MNKSFDQVFLLPDVFTDRFTLAWRARKVVTVTSTRTLGGGAGPAGGEPALQQVTAGDRSSGMFMLFPGMKVTYVQTDIPRDREPTSFVQK